MHLGPHFTVVLICCSSPSQVSTNILESLVCTRIQTTLCALATHVALSSTWFKKTFSFCSEDFYQHYVQKSLVLELNFLTYNIVFFINNRGSHAEYISKLRAAELSQSAPARGPGAKGKYTFYTFRRGVSGLPLVKRCLFLTHLNRA